MSGEESQLADHTSGDGSRVEITQAATGADLQITRAATGADLQITRAATGVKACSLHVPRRRTERGEGGRDRGGQPPSRGRQTGSAEEEPGTRRPKMGWSVTCVNGVRGDVQKRAALRRRLGRSAAC